MNKYVIIVAGGKGIRMGMQKPKQFLEINQYPILMHTINRFINYDPSFQIILGLPEDHISEWELLCLKHKFIIEHSVVKGGNTRFHTVKNCIDSINGEGIIAIHDGVRPFVSNKTIHECFIVAEESGNAIPVVDMNESIRMIKDKSNESVNRQIYKIVQTPQVFQSNIICEAYKSEYRAEFTDDASVVEFAGNKINLVTGNKENIKITTAGDLVLAEYYLKIL